MAEPVKVGVGLNIKLNIGGYDTAGMNFYIEDQSRVINGSMENADQTFERVFALAEKKIEQKSQDWLEKLK